MGKGRRYPDESRTLRDSETGATVRQVTSHPSIHHHPYFTVPAWDDAQRRLIFVSHRSGTPQIFAQERDSGELVQLTERDGLDEWSVHPSHDGRWVYFTAGNEGWRLDLATLAEELVVRLDGEARESGMVAGGMGTTSLSHDDRWWALRARCGKQTALIVVDTETLTAREILRRDQIAHVQFCPDDADLLHYGGPLDDRVWIVNRDGSGNRRLYRRDAAAKQWTTHESWLPGHRELAFVDWPHGVRSVHVETGNVRWLGRFNAWHASCNRAGDLMVADTNLPDIGLQLFDPRADGGAQRLLCRPQASNVGAHWAGPFPYDNGPIPVYAPQHTHPHPTFSPDGRQVVYTSDRDGHAQIYVATIPQPVQESR